MACIFLLKYPTESGPTATFMPSKSAILTGTKFTFKSNAIVHQMSDPRIMYTYIKGAQFRERTYDFLLEEADIAAFYTFWVAALGKSFKLLDPYTDPAYILQRFAPASTEPEITLLNENFYSLVLTFRDALS